MQPKQLSVDKIEDAEILKKIKDKNTSNIDVQLIMAAYLRALAIDLLEKSDDLVARGFRGEYSHVQGSETTEEKPYKEFLDKQKQDGAWGTYIEATILAAHFGFNLAVIDGNNKTIPLYNAGEGAPTIILQNKNNTHWNAIVNNEVVESKRDGNCLYNSIALAFKDKLNGSDSVLPNERTIEKIAIASQEDIEKSIKGLPTTEQYADNLQKEAKEEAQRIEKENQLIARLKELRAKAEKGGTLNEDELKEMKDLEKLQLEGRQEQIRTDRKFALQVALK